MNAKWAILTLLCVLYLVSTSLLFAEPASETIPKSSEEKPSTPTWETPGVDYFTGELVVLSAKNVDSDKDLYVRARRVLVCGDVSLPERTVTINAKTVFGDDGARIDVSGRNGDSVRPVQAPAGTTWGSGGTEGRFGNPGRKAGRIIIFARDIVGRLKLVANGGKGGEGQRGGDGHQGAPGKDGADGKKHHDQQRFGKPGAPGGTGGAAGRGGRGGDGGDAGILLVHLARVPDPKGLILHAEGGRPGSGGKNGKRGPGGDGGDGGEMWEYESDDVDPGPVGDRKIDRSAPALRGGGWKRVGWAKKGKTGPLGLIPVKASSGRKGRSHYERSNGTMDYSKALLIDPKPRTDEAR